MGVKYHSDFSDYKFNPYCFPPNVDVHKTIELFEAQNAARKGLYKRYIDIPKDRVISLSKRVTTTAISVLVLYKPAAQFIVPAIGISFCVRYISKVNLKAEWSEISISLMHVALSVSALAIGIFDTQMGSAIVKTQIIIISIKPFLSAIDRRDTRAILEITARIIKNLLAIAAFATGTLEVLVIYQLARILLKAYSAFKEYYFKDRYIEAVGFLLVTAIRSYKVVPKLEEVYDKYHN